MPINRRNFIRKHSNIRVLQSYFGDAVRIHVSFPQGMKSCLRNKNSYAYQLNLHEKYAEDLTNLVISDIRQFAPQNSYLNVEGEFFRFVANSQYLSIGLRDNWFAESIGKRETHPKHRAFWNRLEYKIEVLAEQYQDNLKVASKLMRKFKKENRDMFDVNDDLRLGFNLDTYEPYKNLFSDRYLSLLNIPEKAEAGYVCNNEELRELNASLPFEDAAKLLEEELDGIGVCWLTGHFGPVRQVRFYGKLVTLNMNYIELNNLPLRWLSCVNSYVYTHDPRLAIAKVRMNSILSDKLGARPPNSTRYFQEGFLEEKGLVYCEGSDDWSDSPQYLFESDVKYSHEYAMSYFISKEHPDKGYVWLDKNCPLVLKAHDYFNPDPRERYRYSQGNSCIITFPQRPEKYYGYMRHNKYGELQTTKHPKPKERYYGIEIELEVKNRRYVDARLMLMKVIPVLKEIGFVSGSDYSLTHGVEFRSCPQTFSVLRENLTRFYETVEPYFEARETCGVHIHVSSSSLSNLQVGKLIGFVYNPDNNSFIEEVARRESGRWQEYTSGSSFNSLTTYNTSPIQPTKISLNKTKVRCVGRASIENGKRKLRLMQFHNGYNKYTAINTLNEHTVEFRLFKGTGDRSTCLTYLEFVDALCLYTETGKVDKPLYDQLSYGGFLEWLSRNGQKFKNLCNYLSVDNNPTSDITNYDFRTWSERQLKKGKLCA